MSSYENVTYRGPVSSSYATRSHVVLVVVTNACLVGIVVGARIIYVRILDTEEKIAK